VTRVVFIADKPDTLSGQSLGVLSASLLNTIDPKPAAKTVKSVVAATARQASGPDQQAKWLGVLGLGNDASWEKIEAAHSSLVSDLTPGVGANHSRVQLANEMLAEVNEAFDALRLNFAA